MLCLAPGGRYRNDLLARGSPVSPGHVGCMPSPARAAMSVALLCTWAWRTKGPCSIVGPSPSSSSAVKGQSCGPRTNYGVFIVCLADMVRNLIHLHLRTVALPLTQYVPFCVPA